MFANLFATKFINSGLFLNQIEGRQKYLNLPARQRKFQEWSIENHLFN